ncbi:MAG: hypothetical protein ABI866_12210 [Dokdonella sp.]
MQTSLADRREPASSSRLVLASMLAALALTVAFRAAFSAYFLLDDFGMLSIVRFLDNPLEPFVRNHIPGGLYYRPLGMIVWWLSERAFGANALAHYLINLFLHAGVAVALWRLVSQFCGNRWIGLATAACFALHPIGIGTTLWLSDRFDLLALLFGLLGMTSAIDFSRNRAQRSLWMTLALLSVALLSKEIALACFAATGVIWLHAEAEPRVAARVRSCLVLALPVVIYLVVRFMVLGFPSAEMLSGNEGNSGSAALLVEGFSNWAVGWLDYSTYFSRFDSWKKTASVVGVVALLVLAATASMQPWSLRRRQAVLAGLMLWLSTGLLQFPLLGHFSVRLDETTDTVGAIVSSRYFYSSLAGFLIAAAAWLLPLCLNRSWARICATSAILMMMMAWFSASQDAARRHRIETQGQKVVVDAAIRSMNAMALPTEGCQVYLLDTESWTFGWISDEAIKAITPDLQRISGCLIQTEHTPWYHIAALDRWDPQSLLPLTFIGGQGETAAPQAIGKARFLLLNLDPNMPVPSSSKARFLSWQGPDFVDVTDAVLSGRRKPGFVCNRSPSQCR